MKITRVGVGYLGTGCPPGGQPVHGWDAPRGATCPGGHDKLGHRPFELFMLDIRSYCFTLIYYFAHLPISCQVVGRFRISV